MANVMIDDPGRVLEYIGVCPVYVFMVVSKKRTFNH